MINNIYLFLVKKITQKDTAEYWWHLRNKIKSGRNKFVKYYYMLKHYRLMNRHSASIPANVDIGNLPQLPHGLNGIFISQLAQIGCGCTIFNK